MTRYDKSTVSRICIEYFCTPEKKLRKTGIVLLFSLFFLLASSPVFYPIKYLFIKAVEAVIVGRPLNFLHWLNFLNTKCLFISAILFFLFLLCKFIEKRKPAYLFPLCIVTSFIASNVFAMKNGFLLGYANFWDFNDFAPGYGGASGFYNTNYPPLAVWVFQLMATIYPKNAAYSPEYARKYLLTLYFISTVLALFVLFSKQLGEGQKHKNLLSGAFFLTGPLLFAYQRMNIMHLALIFTMVFVLWNSSPERWKRFLSLVSLAAAANIKYFPAIFGLVLVKQRRWKATALCFLMGIYFFAFPAFLPKSHSDPVTRNSHAEQAVPAAEKLSVPAERVKSIVSAVSHFTSNPSVLTSVSAEAIAYRLAKRAGVTSSRTMDVIMRASLAFFLFLAFSAFFLAKDRHTELLILSMLAILTPISSAWYGLIFLFIPFLELLKKQSFSVIEGIEFVLYILIFIFVLDGRFSFLMPNSSWHVVLLFFVASFKVFFSRLKTGQNSIAINRPEKNSE